MKKAVLAYITATVLFAVALFFTGLSTWRDSFIPTPTPTESVEDDRYKLDLNTATSPDLQQIPGVGPALAENIISYRDEKGPFTDYSELLDVNGIGHEKLKTILEYVRIK